jgi:DNA-binding NarL/FixJ family response regulator
MALLEPEQPEFPDTNLSRQTSLVDEDQRISVMVVGGQKTVGESLAAVLAKEPDIRVVGVASAFPAAVALLDRTHPDVAVMDYRLPDGDGIETARIIRRLKPDLRVIMLVSMANESVVSRAITAGCSGVISKDTTVDKLARVVRSAASGERVMEGEFAGRVERLRRDSTRRKTVLTTREQEVLRAIARGQTTAMVAQALGLSEYTVRNHVRSILGKLDAHTKLEAVVHAARAGLVHLDDE